MPRCGSTGTLYGLPVVWLVQNPLLSTSLSVSQHAPIPSMQWAATTLPARLSRGALLAAESGIPVALVGPADLPSRVDTGSLPLIEASEVIEMDEDPAHGVRRKDSPAIAPLRRCYDGVASAMVSAGNTGATIAQGFFAWVVFGSWSTGDRGDDSCTGGTPTVLLDAGTELRSSSRLARAVCSDGQHLRRTPTRNCESAGRVVVNRGRGRQG